MSHIDVVYWLGFLSGTPFGTVIGILFTAWWLHPCGRRGSREAIVTITCSLSAFAPGMPDRRAVYACSHPGGLMQPRQSIARRVDLPWSR